MSGDQSREHMVSGDNTPMQLPVFVVRDRVLFPGGLLRLSVGKPKSVRLVESLISKREDQHHRAPTSGGGPNILLAIFNQRADVPEGRGPDDVAVTEQRSKSEGEGRVLSNMYRVGCVARVLQMGRVSASDNFQYSVLVQGLSRVRLLRLYEDGPMLHGMVVRLQEEGSISDAEVKALSLNLREAAQALLEVLRSRGHPRALNAREILDAVSAAAPGAVADILASSINISTEQKQAVLEEISLGARLRLVLELVREQTHVLSIASKIHSEVEGKLNSRHREYYLRQQLKAIRSELGEEGAGDGEDISALEAKLEAASLPPEASKVVMRDLSRLKRMQSSQPEYTVVRTYLETVSELPWNSWSEETYDIRRTRDQLDKDHYGLEKVKRRIIEYVAVRSLLSDNKGSILCLVGPPGVGKTSLGRSIAEALQRKFQRLSLGGVHDEAEIRGHRRTYIGAMPGGIVRCLRRAGTRNPVILLDEVDKIGSNVRGGDPAAALLEVLDPEQNDTFTDHYLNLPFDLSSVLFIATANKVDTIPEPLFDRLEVIHVQGYTLEEKVRIAETYLVPKQMRKNGVGSEHIMLPKSTILRVAASYTREAGVRQLERELAAICRHVALKVGIWRQDALGTGTLDSPRQTPPPPHAPAAAFTTGSLSSDDLVMSSDDALGEPVVSDDANVAERNRSVDAAVSVEVSGSRSGAEDSATPEKIDAPVSFGRSHEQAAPADMGDGERPLARDGKQGCSRDRGGGVKGRLRAELGAAGGKVEEVSRGQVQQELRRCREDEPQQNGQESPAFVRVVVTCEMLREILGPEVYESEVAARVAVPGMSTGLAWTPTGGELLFIECTSMPGSGILTLTGKLGEVMRESAQIALSWIRSHEHEICAQLGLGTGGHGTATASHVAAGAGATGAHGAVGVGDGVGLLFPPDFFNEMDLHLHVPAGGVPKDGPSAGVAIASALLSLVLGRPVDTEVAMTGEITLRGLVLPVGGVRDKVLAARRGGIRRVLIPARNRGDLEELPPEASQGLRISLVETIADVVFALFPPLTGDDTSPRREATEAAAGDGAAGRGRGRYQPQHGQEPLSAAGAEGARSRVYRRVATVTGVGCKREWGGEDMAAVPLESFL